MIQELLGLLMTNPQILPHNAGAVVALGHAIRKAHTSRIFVPKETTLNLPAGVICCHFGKMFVEVNSVQPVDESDLIDQLKARCLEFRVILRDNTRASLGCIPPRQIRIARVATDGE